MKRQYFLILFFWLINPVHLYSQSTNYIQGKVINASTHEPLAFATIVIKQNRLGVFANAEGDFRILFNPKFQSDSLIITSIGFKRAGFAIDKLDNTKTNLIYMTPATYILGEVKVVSSRRKLSEIGRAHV